MKELDIFIEMLDGMKTLVESAKAWYTGGDEDMRALNAMLNVYTSEYMNGVADLIAKSDSTEVGDNNENTSN